MIVYKITNNITGKCYIGQTVKTAEKRFKQHCQKQNQCTYLARAMRKYGTENFSIKVLAYCSTTDEMNHREKYCIKLFKSLAPNGYNLTDGGHETRHVTVNRKITDEYRKQCSIRTSGKNNPRYGKEVTFGQRQKMSKAMTGKPGCRHTMLGKKHTEETKRKISEASKGHKYNLGKKRDDKFKQACRERITLRNLKKVKNTETGEIVNSAKELAVQIGVVYSTLINWLNGTNPNKTPWVYLEE